MIRSAGTESASLYEDKKKGLFDRRTLWMSVLLLAGVTAVLFLLTSRNVNGFDEGILLTATMRTMAGQVLHRDFYYDYGPVQLYLMAGLFKVFGPSVLLARLLDAFLASWLVVTLYVLTRRYCNRALAAGAAVMCVLWLIGLAMTQSVMNPSLCTLTLWTSWLILPVDSGSRQRRRALVAGLMAAVMFLFRYDMGIEIVAANLLAATLTAWLLKPGSRGWLHRHVTTMMAPYLAVFGIIVIPAAAAYLAVAPLHDFLYDVVIYMAKYYRLGRGLPLPVPRLGPTFYESAFYLLPVIIVLGVYVSVARRVARGTGADQAVSQTPDWVNLVVSLSVASALICMRGLVRAGIGGIYVSLMTCILLAALLVQHRAVLNVWLRGLFAPTVALFVCTAISAAWVQLFYPTQSFAHPHLRPLAINWIMTPDRQPPDAEWRSWCEDDTPITRGFCFLLDKDHIQAVRYLDEHTRPGDFLYVGLPSHDRIILNDNILYFAVQRMPAVRWSQFDPFLQNRADIQEEMIGSLQQHRPPFVVLDNEFDQTWEPNGSSVHTGVHLLDAYIGAHYKTVQQYGELTILQRQD